MDGERASSARTWLASKICALCRASLGQHQRREALAPAAGEDFKDAELEHQNSISQSHVLPHELRSEEGWLLRRRS
jgi:hypothetical protein